MISINFWLERPPFAIVGFLKPLKQELGESLHIYIRDDSVSNRKGLDENSLSELKCVYVHKDLSDLPEDPNVVNGINIVNGFNSFVLSFLKNKRKTNPSLKLGCYTEMPSAMGSFKWLKKLLLKYKYRKIIKSNIGDFDFLLPIGEMANEYFKKIGWNKLTYPFVYIPDLKIGSQSHRTIDFDNGAFCYIGRNDFSNKGLNKAIRFFKKHPQLKFIIVGDYGNNSEAVSRIAGQHNNIMKTPSIPPCSVLEYIEDNNIQCILVPSNTDGWNPNVYLALASGTPCIASLNSGSSDLIEKYKYGFVCSSTYGSLKKSILQFQRMSNDQKKELSLNASSGFVSFNPKQISLDLIDFLSKHFNNL